jgi:hypothetical protein
MLRFPALSPDAQAYYDGLEEKRFNTFSADYITNILETRARAPPELLRH